MSNNGSNTLTRGLSVLGKLFVGSRKGPSGERVRRLKKLQKRIGVRFTDLSLLEQALTHRSYSHVTAQTRNDSNERMEFLGDSVLGLSVSQFLYLEFPDRSEGALSKMKSLLVSRKVLSTVSRLVGLGEYLLLSGEEADMGGRDRTSILADSFEGLIGAIYLDQGYRAANLFIRRTLLSDINEILKDEEHTNYKSLLQEHVQSRRLSHPVYRVRREEGPEHEKEFAVDVIVRGEPWGSGRGKSKKDAEQNAARAALERRQEKSSRSSKSRPSRGAAETSETSETRESPETREPRARRGRRSGESRPGRKTPPEAAQTTPSRPRGDHGVAASRERIRAQRSEDGESSRRGEARSRRVSDRPVRERVTREPKEPREPRVRERGSSADTDNDQARSPGEESTRRRRRRRGSRGGAGRSSSSESAASKASSEAAGAITDGADAAPQEGVSADAGRTETRSQAPREGRRRRRERPRREERAETPAESPDAGQEAPETPRREERARVRRAETAPRNEETAPADAPSAEVETKPRRRGRSARRSSRPEPTARREPKAPEAPPEAPGDAPASGPGLEPAREGSEGFARRKKRVVRGFGRR